MIAELDVLLLSQEEPGKILTHGGDIDNRLKTLFDALPMPKDASEIPPGDKPGANEAPFYCLLEDDALVKRVAIDTDRLLISQGDQSDVQLLVSTRVFATEVYIELTGRRLVQPW